MAFAAGLAVGSAVSAGCGTGTSREELGNVVYEMPDVPGMDTTYPLPELSGVESSPEPQPAANAHDHDHTHDDGHSHEP
jgi:hypothetical protein